MIYDHFQAKLLPLGLQPGKSLFLLTIPADITQAVMLRQPLGGAKIDPHIPARHRGELQVVTRHPEPLAGARLAASLQKALTSQSREFFAATADHGPGHVDLCFPKTLPVNYPRLDSNLFEWSQTFDVVWAVMPN